MEIQPKAAQRRSRLVYMLYDDTSLKRRYFTSLREARAASAQCPHPSTALEYRDGDLGGWWDPVARKGYGHWERIK